MSCPDCFKGAVHDHAGDAQGTMQTMHGYPCYVASASAPAKSKSTIIFFCDAFGLNLINNKLLCDKYAAETGFRVIAPDIIPGGAAPVSMMAHMENYMGKKIAWWDIWGQLKRAFTLLRVMSVFVPFLFWAYPTKAFPSCLKFARSVRAELPPGAKLGVAGFCWGGYPSTNLCKEPALEGGKERLVDAQFCAHPSFLSTPGMIVDAISTFHTAYSMAIGDKDFVYAEKKVLDTQAALRERVGDPEENDYEIRIYKGCNHGFAVRAMPGNKVEMTAMEEAREQAVNWFKKYL
jgi:dienelactone hydrolase